MTEHEFAAGVETIHGHITAGDVYQLVLSIRFDGETDLDPFTVYRALRLLNPSPYMYYLDFGDFQIAGASPEPLVKVMREFRPVPVLLAREYRLVRVLPDRAPKILNGCRMILTVWKMVCLSHCFRGFFRPPGSYLFSVPEARLSADSALRFAPCE
jgi:hypothetical protein